MTKVNHVLQYVTAATLIALIAVLIPATFLPYHRAAQIIYFAHWFQWTFGTVFFGLACCRIIIGLLLKKPRDIAVHTGIIVLLIGAVLSSKSIGGKVTIQEGDYVDSFRAEGTGRVVLPSPIVLLDFSEENQSNRVLIGGEEFEFSPSHPLMKWGYFLYSHEHDLKWDVKKVTLVDHRGDTLNFDRANRKQPYEKYVLSLTGLAVNNKKDTLAELAVFSDNDMVGALYVGEGGILPPSYGLDFTLSEYECTTSYISTIAIIRDPGFPYAILGIGICIIGFMVAVIDRRWIQQR